MQILILRLLIMRKKKKTEYDKVKAHFIIETKKLILKLKNKLKDNDKVALVFKTRYIW